MRARIFFFCLRDDRTIIRSLQGTPQNIEFEEKTNGKEGKIKDKHGDSQAFVHFPAKTGNRHNDE